MEFDPGVIGSEAPVDRHVLSVAPGLVGRDGTLQGIGVGISALETGAAQHTELNLRHVQPTGVFGGVVKLQAFHDAPGFGGGKGLVQRRHAVGVQIVQDHADDGGVGVGHVYQPPHLVGEVLHGATFGDSHMAPARQRLAEQEKVAGAAASVLVVLTSGTSRLGGQGFPHLGQQLSGSLVEAHHRPVGVAGLGIQVQHVLHGCHELPVHLGDAPLLFLPGLEGVFFSRSLTVSYDRLSTTPNSTTLSASNLSVQWS